METKAWYKSKVVWSNVLTFLAMAVALQEVRDVIPLSWTPYIGAANAAYNAWLRKNTAVPLGRRDQ